MRIREGGETCSCSRQGCLEAYVGTAGILRRLERKLASDTPSSLRNPDTGSITPKQISLAAKEGDTLAADVLAETGYWLGIGLSAAANLLNLERAVIGGGIAGAGDLILDPARDSFSRQALSVSAESMTIVPAALGNSAGLIGAATLAMKG